MIEWIEHFSVVEQIFLGMALIGGIIFFIQLVMMLIGGVDTTDGSTGDFSGSDFVFKYISVQSLTAFFMVAGLSGLYACSLGCNTFVAIIVSVVSGAAIAWLLVRATELLLRLQSQGNVSLKNAIGQSGSVYMLIPADSEGKVEINLQGRRLYVKAVSREHVELKYGERVTVTSVSGDDTLVVIKEELK